MNTKYDMLAFEQICEELKIENIEELPNILKGDFIKIFKAVRVVIFYGVKCAKRHGIDNEEVIESMEDIAKIITNIKQCFKYIAEFTKAINDFFDMDETIEESELKTVDKKKIAT